MDKQNIQNTLRRVQHPELHKDLVTLNMVEHISVCDGYINVKIARAGKVQALIERDVKAALQRAFPDAQQINLEFTANDAPVDAQAAAASGGQKDTTGQMHQPQQPAGESAESALPGVRHIIAVGAGKGGVGKSTVAVNLAVGLSQAGHKTGLLDGDIYGPSVPTLLGLEDQQPQGTAQTLFPFRVHGISAMTIGKLVDPNKPLIWRGPMAHGAFRQLALQTDWGELDYLIVDLPPGTGDVPLTMSQLLPLSGAIIVCTPQKVAQDDAVRAAGMFQQLEIPVMGVVENMSYFIGDDGKEYDIFGRGGAARMAQKLELPLLGTIPIHMELRENSDAGEPLRNFQGNEQLSRELTGFARSVIERTEEMAQQSQGPSLSIS